MVIVIRLDQNNDIGMPTKEVQGTFGDDGNVVYLE